MEHKGYKGFRGIYIGQIKVIQEIEHDLEILSFIGQE